LKNSLNILSEKNGPVCVPKSSLVESDTPISEISLNCGYENLAHFSYTFKKHIGMTPGKFRKISNTL
jgi:AraC-like DNA-binding protein